MLCPSVRSSVRCLFVSLVLLVAYECGAYDEGEPQRLTGVLPCDGGEVRHQRSPEVEPQHHDRHAKLRGNRDAVVDVVFEFNLFVRSVYNSN